MEDATPTKWSNTPSTGKIEKPLFLRIYFSLEKNTAKSEKDWRNLGKKVKSKFKTSVPKKIKQYFESKTHNNTAINCVNEFKNIFINKVFKLR